MHPFFNEYRYILLYMILLDHDLKHVLFNTSCCVVLQIGLCYVANSVMPHIKFCCTALQILLHVKFCQS